jgi:PAS domain S-box-containing protein
MPTETGVEETRPDVSVHDELMAMTLDRTSDGVLLTTRTAEIVYANQPLLDLFGYAAGELVGKRVEVLIPDDIRRSHRSHVEKFSKSPQPRPMGRPDLDIEGRRADGTRFPVDVQLNPLADTGLVVATVRDMTVERRRVADLALSSLDLATARSENVRLTQALDLVVQRLFALGMTLSAMARNDPTTGSPLDPVVGAIDEIVEAVHAARKADGPQRSGTSGP